MATSFLLIVLGFAPQHVVYSTGSQQKSSAGIGIITGVVVDERREPVEGARVHAFLVRASIPQGQDGPTQAFTTRADGSTATDADGRFRLSGLGPGDYLVVAEPVRFLTSEGSKEAALYARTFYPSTTDAEAAARVSVTTDEAGPIQIALVRVKGAKVAGSVVSRGGRPAGAGMEVRLAYQFGGFRSESPAAVVDADGNFAIARVPPGWYRLTVERRQTTSSGERGEFATTSIEVQQTDIERLLLALGPGASITGRVVAEPAAGIASAVGMRVGAWIDGEAPWRSVLATVASDWSFQMSGLDGSYQFSARNDRPPFVEATRISVDGVERAIDTAFDFTDGTHDVIVFVTPREPPVPLAEKSLPLAALVERFRSERQFWRQFEIAKEIADRKDSSVLSSLAGWLTHEDRHIRGNVAFLFGRLGDPRGLQVIIDILADRSDRAEGQGGAGVSSDGRYRVEGQIRADRYYAAHLLGDLRDPQAVPILVPLLKDKDVNYIVPWALGEIGHKSAVGPLLDTLDEDNPSMRVLAIYALETLNAKEAVPRLIALLDDHRKSNFGAGVPVAEAAKGAIAKLR